VAVKKPEKTPYPQLIESEPQQTRLSRILAPPLSEVVFSEMSEPDMQDTCGSLSEWIAMVQLGSPRVFADDHVDPYLSRYAVPDVDQSRATNLISLKWHGFISSKWIMQLFVALL